MAKWTPEQLDAFQDRNHNLLVAAAAGAGKTAVLVERIINLVVADRIDIDRMLVATFTQAAAGEMRSRISARLLEAMDEDDADHGYLQSQMGILNRATIGTLHAFCMEVVRKYFHLLDIDPHFRVGDDTETAMIKQEVLEELLEEEYISGQLDYLSLAEMFSGGKDDQPLQELILRTYEFIQSQPEPLAWMQASADRFARAEGDSEKNPWMKVLAGQLGVELAGIKDLFTTALAITQQPGGPATYNQALTRDLHTVTGLLSALGEGLDPFYEELGLLQFTRLAPAPKDVDPHLRDETKSLREQGKKLLQDLRTKVFFLSPAEFLRDMHEMHGSLLCLSRLIRDFSDRYRHHKTELGIVDFSDLEHFALELLSDTRVAEDYRQRYDCIFVDEYQDINLVQETILTRIKRADNLFMVGDVKQSIYRFRLADPAIFLDKYRNYQTAADAPQRRIDLSTNFRSRPQIIHAINHLFGQLMSRDLGEIEYDEAARLIPGITLPEQSGTNMLAPEMEFLLIDHQRDDEPGLEEDGDVSVADLENAEVEAHLAAARIKSLYGQPFYDSKGKCHRTLEYRDIVVLMRATRSQAEVYYDTFTAAGIPVYADVDRGYFQALEVNIFINLLRLIDNKRQDIPLLSVMRSPIGGFSVDDLIAIRSCGTGTFFAAITTYLAQPEDELQLRLRAFIHRLDAWKKDARVTELDEFIWGLMLETGFYYYMGAMPGGLQRQANLRILLERAGQFQATSLKGLFHFIKFVDKLQSGSGDMGMAKILGENENVVRIMSIHKSKGLEFPVVILAGLGRKFNTRDTSAPVLFHKELGIAPRYINPDLRVVRDTLPRITMKNLIKMEGLAEEMRILYVACTRPREKLIMIGSVNNLARQAKKWSQAINPFQLSRGRSCLDWVGPVFMRHPDGQDLRGQIDWELPEPGSKDVQYDLQVQILGRHQVIAGKRSEETLPGIETLISRAGEGAPERGDIWSKLAWHYPYPEAAKIPSKMSVSQVKALQVSNLDDVHAGPLSMTPQPVFMQEGAPLIFTGAARGSIMHLVMQHLDLARVGSATEIREQMCGMVERDLLRNEEIEAIDPQQVMNFFVAPLGERLLRSSQINREVPFNLVFRAARVFSGIEESGEDLLLQGVVDLFFLEDGELVLVDYKTDRITPQNRGELVERYRIQLEIYKEALEKIQAKRVKAAYLYFFDIDEAVEIG